MDFAGHLVHNGDPARTERFLYCVENQVRVHRSVAQQYVDERKSEFGPSCQHDMGLSEEYGNREPVWHVADRVLANHRRSDTTRRRLRRLDKLALVSNQGRAVIQLGKYL